MLRGQFSQKEYESEGWKIKLQSLEEELRYQSDRNSELSEHNKKLQVGITSSSGDKSVIESKLSEL